MSFKQNPVSCEFINKNFQDMLNEHLGDNVIDFNENLSTSQKIAFEMFKNGDNLLILGSAGTGKSKLIKTMEEYTQNNRGRENSKNIYVCSTTGISAYNIGGITIHSFVGIGTGDLEINQLIKKVSKKKSQRDRILNTDILVIDEISMMSASLFEKLNAIFQSIRKNSLFFGGVQVILTGDLFQLLAVFNTNKAIYKEIDERLIVESPLFNNIFNKEKNNIVTLKENFRQKGDPTFIDLLLRIRDGTFTEEDILKLNARKLVPENISNHLHLVSSNKKAQMINQIELDKLKTETYKYTTIYTRSGSNKDTNDILIKELESQLNLRGLNELTLKIGTRVILVKNLDIDSGLVNGSIGTVEKFVIDKNSGLNIPFVHFDNNIKQVILPSLWEIDLDNCKATATQIPLMLAYAITCHKSQSLSMDSAVLDLEDAFCNHMVYVSLSRVRSLNGIYLKSFDPKKITINKVMKDFLDKST